MISLRDLTTTQRALLAAGGTVVLLALVVLLAASDLNLDGNRTLRAVHVGGDGTVVETQYNPAGIAGLREESVPAGGDKELEALLSGKCDAIVSTPPESIEAHRQGCNTLIDFSEYGLNYALGGIAARRDYVERNPEITRQFIKAYVEGMHRYRTDREFTVSVQAEYSGIADRTVAEATYDLTRPGMPPVPYPVVASLQTLIDFMAAELPEARNADARKFIDDRFIRELEDNGFIAALGQSS